MLEGNKRTLSYIPRKGTGWIFGGLSRTSKLCRLVRIFAVKETGKDVSSGEMWMEKDSKDEVTKGPRLKTYASFWNATLGVPLPLSDMVCCFAVLLFFVVWMNDSCLGAY